MSDQSESRSESEEMKRKYESGESSTEEENNNSSNTSETKKTCVDCGTSKTPLWRGGPAGPKSLCNACGIKSRKKRQAALGIRTEEKKKKSSKINNHHNKNNNVSRKENKNNMKHRFLDLGKEAVMKPWRKLGEEEQAAILLMALSYGYVYA